MQFPHYLVFARSVLHVDILKARAMFAPISRAVKKSYGATLKEDVILFVTVKG